MFKFVHCEKPHSVYSSRSRKCNWWCVTKIVRIHILCKIMQNARPFDYKESWVCCVFARSLVYWNVRNTFVFDISIIFYFIAVEVANGFRQIRYSFINEIRLPKLSSWRYCRQCMDPVISEIKLLLLYFQSDLCNVSKFPIRTANSSELKRICFWHYLTFKYNHFHVWLTINQIRTF